MQLYILYLCCFRRAPHRWLSTFCMPINHRVSNSTRRQRQLMHQQKVSYRTLIVSISLYFGSFCGTCLYWPSQFPLCLSLSLFAPGPKAVSFLSLYGGSILKYDGCRRIIVNARRTMIRILRRSSSASLYFVIVMIWQMLQPFSRQDAALNIHAHQLFTTICQKRFSIRSKHRPYEF